MDYGLWIMNQTIAIPHTHSCTASRAFFAHEPRWNWTMGLIGPSNNKKKAAEQ